MSTDTYKEGDRILFKSPIEELVGISLRDAGEAIEDFIDISFPNGFRCAFRNNEGNLSLICRKARRRHP